MDQPFAALVKELFDMQKYPELRAPDAARGRSRRRGPRRRWRRRRTGWTRRALRQLQRPRRPRPPRQRLPAVAEWRGGRWRRRSAGGGAAALRPGLAPASLRRHWLDAAHADGRRDRRGGRTRFRRDAPRSASRSQVEPIPARSKAPARSSPSRTTPTRPLRAVNDILAAGGSVSFAKTESRHLRYRAPPRHPAEGRRGCRVAQRSARRRRLGEEAAHRPLRTLGRQHRRRLDALDPRAIQIPLHRAAQRRHSATAILHDRFDAIVFAEMATRQIMDGMAAGSVPGQYAGGIGETGAQALRDFVTARRHARDARQRHPLRHRAVQSRRSPTSCRAFRRTSSSAPARCCAPKSRSRTTPWSPGFPPAPPSCSSATRSSTRARHSADAVLASYVKDRNPLLSGFLLGADRIQGKAAAHRRRLRQGPHHPARLPAAMARAIARHLQVSLQRALLQPVDGAGRPGPQAGAAAVAEGDPQQAAWRREAEAVKDRADQSCSTRTSAYFTARGPDAADEGKKLEDRAGRLPARPPAAARRSARASGRRRTFASRRRIRRAAQKIRRRPAHQRFQRLQAGRSARSIQTGGDPVTAQTRMYSRCGAVFLPALPLS